jgi:hypothetical protein
VRAPPGREPRARPAGGRSGRGGHPERRAERRDHFWTFYLSPTFDTCIKDTIARFEATYPGVKVNWEDHQATFKDDLNNAFSPASRRTSSTSRSARAGSASTPARASSSPLDDKVPQTVKDIYFPGLWNEQLVDGRTTSSRGTRASTSS